MTAIEKLKARLPSVRSQAVGISAEDVAAIRFSDDYFSEVVEAITSPNVTDQRIGYFFAKQLAAGKLSSLQKSALVAAALEALKQNDWILRESAATLLVKFGAGHCDLRQIMLPLLSDPTGVVRKVALRSFPTYASRNDLEVLLPFENDGYTAEVGMGSHLIYELRNLALETIESMIGRQFKKGERTVSLPNQTVAFWWDWEPFHKWRKSFWRRVLPG